MEVYRGERVVMPVPSPHVLAGAMPCWLKLVSVPLESAVSNQDNVVRPALGHIPSLTCEDILKT